jgi:hypothetical protein
VDRLKAVLSKRKARTEAEKASKQADYESLFEEAERIGNGGEKIKKVKFFITYGARNLKELRKAQYDMRSLLMECKVKIHKC